MNIDISDNVHTNENDVNDLLNSKLHAIRN